MDEDTSGVYDLEKGLKALDSFGEEDEREDVISIEFTKKRYFKVMSKRNKGNVKIDYLKLKMERALGDVSMSSLLRELSRGHTQTSRILRSKDMEVSRLRRDLSEAKQLEKDAIAAKIVGERSMVTKFVKLLNSKKVEIKRLKDQMKELRSLKFSSPDRRTVSQKKQSRSQLYPTQYPPGESIEAANDESSEDNAPTDDSEAEDVLLPQSPKNDNLERRKSGWAFVNKYLSDDDEDDDEEGKDEQILRNKRARVVTTTTSSRVSSSPPSKRRRRTLKAKKKKKKSPRETKLSDTKYASSSNNTHASPSNNTASNNVDWNDLL